MKTRTEVTVQKLRGGFYTPDELVNLAYSRLASRLRKTGQLSLLEPAAGDGAFLKGIGRSSIGARFDHVTAVEILDTEAQQCRTLANELDLPVEVVAEDFLRWQMQDKQHFDAAVGNPPFVRFQFVDEVSKRIAKDLASEEGLEPRGVSNLWIPILLGALRRLAVGGAFAFVIPAECFTGISAGSFRSWLIRECEDIHFDLFPPASFPDVLQEVVILSGRRSGSRSESRDITVADHGQGGSGWTYSVTADGSTWTRWLLQPDHLDALQAVQALPDIHPLGAVAKFEVAAVTGANSYFSVDQATLKEFGLRPWAIPLLPRIRHADGLIFSQDEHDQLTAAGIRASLLHFSADRPDPEDYESAALYLRLGESQGLDQRYKTRIREPWYRIPLVRSEPLLLSKRAHHYHRVVLNHADVVTTDTIYRGWLLTDQITESDFVSAFHSSLALLTAEIEGRSFGGGVLELVPSEIVRLSVPVIPGFGSELGRLDEVARSNGKQGSEEALIDETNALIVKEDVGITSELIDTLEEARRQLARRRLDRSSDTSSDDVGGQQVLDLTT